MHHRWSKPIRSSFIVAVVLLCGVTLTGCDVLDFLGNIFGFSNGNEARAQQDGDGVVETFLVSSGSLSITSTSGRLVLGTNVEVNDQVIIYKQIEGTFSFIPASGGSRDFRDLAMEDILIERFTPSLVTWIREQD